MSTTQPDPITLQDGKLDAEHDNAVWATRHVQQPGLNIIYLGERYSPAAYTIKPLQWVWNSHQRTWEAPCVFGRLTLYCTYTTAMWNLCLPGFTSSHPTRIEALRAAWVWYKNELGIKVLKLDHSSDSDTKDAERSAL